MKKKDIDMLNGPIVPSMIFFAIPMLISGLLQICFNAADTIVVGRFAGHTSMAAIGSTASITNLMVNLFIGISMGVNVVVARAIGRGDRPYSGFHFRSHPLCHGLFPFADSSRLDGHSS